MAEPNKDALEAGADTLIDDATISRYILEMVIHLSRLATRVGDEPLAHDLKTVSARAELREKRLLN